MSSIGIDPARDLLARLGEHVRNLQKVGPPNLSLRQYAIILVCLGRKEGIAADEIAETLDLADATLRRSLARLTERGLLVRHPPSGKAGTARLVASPAARRLAEGYAGTKPIPMKER